MSKLVIYCILTVLILCSGVVTYAFGDDPNPGVFIGVFIGGLIAGWIVVELIKEYLDRRRWNAYVNLCDKHGRRPQ